MRSSIFLVVPFAALALGQSTNSRGVVTTTPAVISQPAIPSANASVPTVPPPSSPVVLVSSNTTVTTGSIKQTATATTVTGTQTNSAATSKSGTSSSPAASSTGAAARMIQPVIGLGLAGAIVVALF